MIWIITRDNSKMFSSFLQLTPIERYAMNFLEASLEDVCKEELKQAEVTHCLDFTLLLLCMFTLNCNKSCVCGFLSLSDLQFISNLCSVIHITVTVFSCITTKAKCMKFSSAIVCSGASGGCQERLGPGQRGGSKAPRFI